MRPVERIRQELVETGLTVMAARSDGQDRAQLELEAGEAIRRSYEELGSDEQEALRVALGVPEGASADEVGLSLLDDVRARSSTGGEES